MLGVALAVTAIAASPASATAGERPGPVGAPTVVAPAANAPVTAATSRPGSLRKAAAADVITCTPQVQNPHNSSHVNGTVNVVVTLSCSSSVTYISIRAALYRNGSLVKDSGSKTVYGTSKAQNNAAVPCSNATYQGWMSYYVQFPPGYTPPSGASSGYGNSVYITC
jgi:hypothetical protein